MKQELFSARSMTLTALFTALTCVLAPFSLPIGPIPVSLTNFVLFLSLIVLGGAQTFLSYIVYILIGAVGLPVFSGFTGGPAKLAGPTGGYIIGFLPMVLLAGWFIRAFGGRFFPSLVGMVLGMAVAYALGTAWYVYLMGCSVWQALTLCVFPFVLIDLVKMGVAYQAGTALRRGLQRARLLEG